jgi:hypothetical protein
MVWEGWRSPCLLLGTTKWVCSISLVVTHQNTFISCFVLAILYCCISLVVPYLLFQHIFKLVIKLLDQLKNKLMMASVKSEYCCLICCLYWKLLLCTAVYCKMQILHSKLVLRLTFF